MQQFDWSGRREEGPHLICGTVCHPAGAEGLRGSSFFDDMSHKRYYSSGGHDYMVDNRGIVSHTTDLGPSIKGVRPEARGSMFGLGKTRKRKRGGTTGLRIQPSPAMVVRWVNEQAARRGGFISPFGLLTPEGSSPDIPGNVFASDAWRRGGGGGGMQIVGVGR